MPTIDIWIYLLTQKSKAQSILIRFQKMVQLQLNKKIKMVQSDWRGGEYRPLTTFVQNLGIIHKVSCTHTPQQNGVAERKHRAIVEIGLTLFAQSSILLHLWDDALSTSVYLINRLPTKLMQYSCPLETLYKVNQTTLS